MAKKELVMETVVMCQRKHKEMDMKKEIAIRNANARKYLKSKANKKLVFIDKLAAISSTTALIASVIAFILVTYARFVQ